MEETMRIRYVDPVAEREKKKMLDAIRKGEKMSQLDGASPTKQLKTTR